jgi:hypothetical protein
MDATQAARFMAKKSTFAEGHLRFQNHTFLAAYGSIIFNCKEV